MENSIKEKNELIEKVAKEVVERGLTAPAIFFLETGKPFSFLGNQFLIFLNPIVQVILNSKYYDLIINLLEDRNNIEKLICKIEEMEEQKKTEISNK